MNRRLEIAAVARRLMCAHGALDAARRNLAAAEADVVAAGLDPDTVHAAVITFGVSGRRFTNAEIEIAGACGLDVEQRAVQRVSDSTVEEQRAYQINMALWAAVTGADLPPESPVYLGDVPSASIAEVHRQLVQQLDTGGV